MSPLAAPEFVPACSAQSRRGPWCWRGARWRRVKERRCAHASRAAAVATRSRRWRARGRSTTWGPAAHLGALTCSSSGAGSRRGSRASAASCAPTRANPCAGCAETPCGRGRATGAATCRSSCASGTQTGARGTLWWVGTARWRHSCSPRVRLHPGSSCGALAAAAHTVPVCVPSSPHWLSLPLFISIDAAVHW